MAILGAVFAYLTVAEYVPGAGFSIRFLSSWNLSPLSVPNLGAVLLAFLATSYAPGAGLLTSSLLI